MRQRCADAMNVSIHVPARGTTIARLRSSILRTFQSTFPQGERQPENHPRSTPIRFNPRSRKVNDYSSMSFISPFTSFNPRSRKGNDYAGNTIIWQKCRFNPRSRKGNDRKLRWSVTDTRCFNPRSRKGNDFRAEKRARITHVSIHVPARGPTGNHFPGIIPS